MAFLRTSARLCAGVLAVLLGAAACTSGTPAPRASASASATSSETSVTGTAGLASTAWRSVPRDQVRDGGTLTLSLDALPQTYQLNDPNSSLDLQRISNLYLPSFVRIGADGSWTADPDYTASLTVRSQDPQVVELRIAPAATWSDGTPMTWHDLAASWHAFNGSDTAYQPASTAVWQDVKSITRGDDDRDVLITFAKKDADWPALLGSVYPSWAVDTPKHFASAWKNGPFAPDGATYVSAGPFVVRSIDTNAGVVTLGRNPRWWGDPARLDTVVFRTVSRDSLGQAFANRELDAVDVMGMPDVLTAARARPSTTVEQSAGTVARQLTLNGASGVFADPAVRKAFAQVVDRRVLAEAVLGQVGAPVQTLGSVIFVPGQQGYADHASGVLTASAADARSTLEADGWVIGPDGVATKGGTRLTARFVVPQGAATVATIAQLVKQQAKAAGFDVTVQTVPGSDFFSSYVTTDKRNFDVTSFAWIAGAFPIATAEAYFYPADSGSNYGGVTDQSLGTAWDALNAELDPAKRLAEAADVDERALELFTMVPLFVEPSTWVVRSDLANYGPSQFQDVRWQDVGYTG